eukprot:gene17986-52952_t
MLPASFPINIAQRFVPPEDVAHAQALLSLVSRMLGNVPGPL